MVEDSKLNFDWKNVPGKIMNVIVKIHVIDKRIFHAFFKLYIKLYKSFFIIQDFLYFLFIFDIMVI